MARKKATKKDIEEILALAKRRGLTNDFFFQTTFQRYLTQLQILDELEKGIKEHGATVEKTYVKGRVNIVENPCIAAYTKTATAANQTLGTLLKILSTAIDENENEDSLNEFLK